MKKNKMIKMDRLVSGRVYDVYSNPNDSHSPVFTNAIVMSFRKETNANYASCCFLFASNAIFSNNLRHSHFHPSIISKQINGGCLNSARIIGTLNYSARFVRRSKRRAPSKMMTKMMSLLSDEELMSFGKDWYVMFECAGLDNLLSKVDKINLQNWKISPVNDDSTDVTPLPLRFKSLA